MSLSQEERNNYEFRLKAIRDEITFKSNAKKQIEEIIKGREELAKGQEELAKGQEELAKEKEKLNKAKEEMYAEKKEIIKNLLKQNFKIEQIAQIIGSDKNEIEQIVKQIKNI